MWAQNGQVMQELAAQCLDPSLPASGRSHHLTVKCISHQCEESLGCRYLTVHFVTKYFNLLRQGEV